MKIIYRKDGNKIMARFEDFINLQESPAGFGDTEEEAKEDLGMNIISYYQREGLQEN